MADDTGLDEAKVDEILKEIGRVLDVVADTRKAAGKEEEFDEALRRFVEEVFNIQIPRDADESPEF